MEIQKETFLCVENKNGTKTNVADTEWNSVGVCYAKRIHVHARSHHNTHTHAHVYGSYHTYAIRHTIENKRVNCHWQHKCACSLNVQLLTVIALCEDVTKGAAADPTDSNWTGWNIRAYMHYLPTLLFAKWQEASKDDDNQRILI